jgi:hypothetical protein
MIIHGEMGSIPLIMYPTYVSFDPGDDVKPSTGITFWNSEGKMMHTNELSVDNLHKLLDWLEDECNPKKFIVEEYRLFQQKAIQQSGSKLPPVQIIGMIKRSAYKLNIPVVEVRADSKSIAAAWSQTKIPSGHMPNWLASRLVGYFHLHQEGIIPAKVLET